MKRNAAPQGIAVLLVSYAHARIVLAHQLVLFRKIAARISCAAQKVIAVKEETVNALHANAKKGVHQAKRNVAFKKPAVKRGIAAMKETAHVAIANARKNAQKLNLLAVDLNHAVPWEIAARKKLAPVRNASVPKHVLHFRSTAVNQRNAAKPVTAVREEIALAKTVFALKDVLHNRIVVPLKLAVLQEIVAKKENACAKTVNALNTARKTKMNAVLSKFAASLVNAALMGHALANCANVPKNVLLNLTVVNIKLAAKQETAAIPKETVLVKTVNAT